MKNLILKFLLVVVVTTISVCKGQKEVLLVPSVISEIIPMALRGETQPPTPEPEPVKSILAFSGQENSSQNQLLTLNTGEVACDPALIEPPANFGNSGPEAFIVLCNPNDLDRYRNIEIRFSHPMNQTSVQSNFTITVNGNPLPGPSPGGIFIWKSAQRLFFDPYRELTSLGNYQISISSSALTADGESLIPFQANFQATHDFLMNLSITQGSNTINLNQDNDITFSSTSGNLILNASWVNPTGISSLVKKIVLNKVGNTTNGIPNPSAKTLCNGNCTEDPISINLNTDEAFINTPLSLTNGGNAYYFEITTTSDTKYQRYFSLNYGTLTNPNNLINNSASIVLDEAQMLKMLERLIELFTQAKFKITDKTFNDFADSPKSNTKNTTYCINYGSFYFITNYGDNPTGGYCGGAGDNPGAFVGYYSGILGTSYFDMDVYVSQINVPPFSGGNPTIDAILQVNSTGELGIDLMGRKSYLKLEVVAKNRSCLALCAVPANSKFHFDTNVELNPSGNYTIRLARARNTLTVNSSGNLVLTVKTPHAPNDSILGNFHVQPWTDNLVVGSMNLVSSTSWVAGLLSIITEMIADGLVPQVKPLITQAVLKDIIETVAPKVLNAVVDTLKDPGIEITLPPYLPAPLANYPLVVKVKLSTDAQVRSNGGNKGIVSSVHAGLFSKTPLPPASQRQHANTVSCGGSGCMVYVKDPSVPLIPITNHAPFDQSATTPGFLLAMHTDLVTQAAYHLWKNRVIDLNVDSNFITTVNNYAGNDPLLNLTNSILKVSAITAIIAPGRKTLPGLDPSNNPLPAVCVEDEVRFKIDPLMPPVAMPLDNTGVNPVVGDKPNIRVTFNNLQITIQGKRTDNSAQCVAQRGAPDNQYYNLTTLRVNMITNALMRILEFDNPNTTPNEFQNSLNLKIFTDGLAYSLEVLEGSTYNPYGLDPKGVLTVFDPLVTTLVVPLVNSILNRVPLPPEVPFAAIKYPSSTTVCKVNVKRDHGLRIDSLAVPGVDAATNPYLFLQARLIGNSLTDPKNLLETACR